MFLRSYHLFIGNSTMQQKCKSKQAQAGSKTYIFSITASENRSITS